MCLWVPQKALLSPRWGLIVCYIFTTVCPLGATLWSLHLFAPFGAEKGLLQLSLVQFGQGRQEN